MSTVAKHNVKEKFFEQLRCLLEQYVRACACIDVVRTKDQLNYFYKQGRSTEYAKQLLNRTKEKTEKLNDTGNKMLQEYWNNNAVSFLEIYNKAIRMSKGKEAVLKIGEKISEINHVFRTDNFEKLCDYDELTIKFCTIGINHIANELLVETSEDMFSVKFHFCELFEQMIDNHIELYESIDAIRFEEKLEDFVTMKDIDKVNFDKPAYVGKGEPSKDLIDRYYQKKEKEESTGTGDRVTILPYLE